MEGRDGIDVFQTRLLCILKVADKCAGGGNSQF